MKWFPLLQARDPLPVPPLGFDLVAFAVFAGLAWLVWKRGGRYRGRGDPLDLRSGRPVFVHIGALRRGCGRRNRCNSARLGHHDERGSPAGHLVDQGLVISDSGTRTSIRSTSPRRSNTAALIFSSSRNSVNFDTCPSARVTVTDPGLSTRR